MKTTILTSFVAIALSTITLANVIPLSAEMDEMSPGPAPFPMRPVGRATLESIETDANGVVAPVPINDVLAVVPARRSQPLVNRGLVNNVLQAGREFGIFFDRGRSRLNLQPSASATSTSLTDLKKRGDNDESTDDNNGNKNKDYDNGTDIQYLNFALFIQQLKFAFFERGLNVYSQQDFMEAGFPEWVRGRYWQIREHQKTHLDFLQSAVTSAGQEHVLPSEYQFSDNDVHAFIDLSEAITTIVTSSYVGGLHYLTNREYTTVASSILALEARQAAWINSAVRRQNPWNTAFETPLTPNQVLTLFTNFFDFDKMPTQNRALLPVGIRPNPRLWLAPRLVPGEEAEISFQDYDLQNGERLYAAFLFGFETIFAPVNERDEMREKSGSSGFENKRRYFVQLPKDLEARGTVFVVVLRGGESISEVRLNDQSTVAGPAIAMFPFGADQEPIGW